MSGSRFQVPGSRFVFWVRFAVLFLVPGSAFAEGADEPVRSSDAGTPAGSTASPSANAA